MAREHARILCSIWAPGDDFRQRSVDAQRLYFLLLSQRELNNAGLLPLMVTKWARLCAGTSVDDIETALKELAEHRYVVVDYDTDEVLVRTFIRNDGVAKQPNVLKNALRLAMQIESVDLRAALARELLRIGHPDALATASELAPETVPHHPTEHLSNGSGNPSQTPPGDPSGTLRMDPAETSAGWGGGRGRGRGSASAGGRVGGRASATPAPAPNLDPDNPRCGEHADIPATERGPNCRACAAVRRQVEADPTIPGLDRAAAADRRAAIAECERCDDEGWREDPDGGPDVRCDHARAEVSS